MVQLYTASEVAKKLRVRPQRVYGWVYTGELEAVQLTDERGLRISEEAISKFLKNRQLQVVNFSAKKFATR